MLEVIKHTTEYFKSHENYFWRWADNGDVIEWKNGSTICYRDDLISILSGLTSHGFPPLGPILLVLASCQDNFHQSGCKFLLRELSKSLKNYNNTNPDQEALNYNLDHAIYFMDMIAGLPDELRKSQRRIHLIREVFEPNTFVISDTGLKGMIEELNSGRLDNLIFTPSVVALQAETFKTDLQYLVKAAQKFPTSEKLSLKLRTGLDGLPLAAPTITPPHLPLDLFSELAKEEKTAGLARLAKRLIAALNIPLHSQGSGDQSYGGISDITNRGNYDKLLLSELAQDDLLLMARLVNNEALYFRREEPPDNPKKQRTILLDTSLRMWGLPRVFAISAALACTRNTKHNELVETYALGGIYYKDVDLSTKQGVVNALEILDPSLHCGPALQSVLKEIETLEQNENFFITDTKQFENPDFHFVYSSIKELIHFIITVSREGVIKLFSSRNGVTKLLNTAKFDLTEILFTTPTNSNTSVYDYETPAFFKQAISPLYFPSARISSNNKERMADLGDRGIITITETQRILWWSESDKGAREVLSYIEKGNYFFGADDTESLYILVNNEQRSLQKLYKLNLARNETEITLDLPYCNTRKVAFLRERMLVPELGRSFDYATGKENPGHTSTELDKFLKEDLQNHRAPEPNKVRQFIDATYNVFFNVKHIYIDEDGFFVLGKHYLQVMNHNTLKFVDASNKRNELKKCKEITEVKGLLSNKHTKFWKTGWSDGSTAIIDARGFIHLRSSNETLPEITIGLILGKATGCWASDGYACGAHFFTDAEISKIIPVPDFYSKNIQRFIDHLA